MKNKHKISSILVLALLLILGCRKTESIDAPQTILSGKELLKSLKKAPLSTFSVHGDGGINLKNLNSILSQRRLNGPGDPLNPHVIMGTYRTGDDIRPLTGSFDKAMYIESFKSNVFVVSPEMGLNIYPGAILNGNSIHADVFAPSILTGISSHIRPINLSTSLPVSSSKVAKTVMARPSSDRAFVRAALKDLNDINPGKIGAARLQYEITSFSNYDMLKTLYGYNKNLNLFLYKNDGSKTASEQTVSRKTGYIVKFYQQNFTVDVDVPSDYNELFDPTGLDTASVYGGHSPYYVSSVTYGRMGIMSIESGSDSTAVYNAITKQIGILQGLVGVGTSMTKAEQDIISGSEIRYAITGPGGNVNSLETINSIQGFVETLQKNSTYSMDEPGVPISFRLRYLSDDTNVEAPFEINYGAFDQPYARVEYRNQRTQQRYLSDDSNLTEYSSDISVVCYPTKECIAGTEIRPLNFINFQWQKTASSSYGVRGNMGGPYTSVSSGGIRNALKNSVIVLPSLNGYYIRTLYGPDPENRRETYREDYILLPGKGYHESATKF